jgi:hypothetical protein
MNRTVMKSTLARVANVILVIRDENVILDSDLALFYGAETRALIQAVKRNDRRFPLDFMFQLTRKEFDACEITNCDLKRQRRSRAAREAMAGKMLVVVR